MNSTLKRTIASVLVMVLLLAGIPSTAVRAEDEPAQSETVEYKVTDVLTGLAVGDAAAYQGKSGWYFQTEQDGTYTNLTHINTWAMWFTVFAKGNNDGAYGGIGKWSFTPNGAIRHSYTFEMPRDGSVQIGASDLLRLQAGGTVRFSIYKADKAGKQVKVWPADSDYVELTNSGAEATYSFAAITLSGKAGDRLHFLVANGEGSNTNKQYVWNPVVTYIGAYDRMQDPSVEEQPEIVEYKVTDALTGLVVGDAAAYQGKNGWYFQTEQDGTYTNLTHINTWATWFTVFAKGNNDGAYGGIGKWSFTPNGAIRHSYTFEMPRDGSVQIGASDLLRLQTGGTVRFSIYKADKAGKQVKVWPADSDYVELTNSGAEATYSFAAITLSGKAGDRLHFLVANGEGSNTNKQYVWNPVVTYLGSYAEEQDPNVDAYERVTYKAVDAMPQDYMAGSADAYQGKNGWYFQTEEAGVYRNLSAIGTWSWVSPAFVGKNNNAGYGALGKWSFSTNSTRNQALTFLVPVDSTMEIEASDLIRLQSEGMLRFSITKEDCLGRTSQLWPENEEWMTLSGSGQEVTYSFQKITVAGKAGDKLHFRIGNAEGSYTNKQYVWNPVVSCVAEYEADLDPVGPVNDSIFKMEDALPGEYIAGDARLYQGKNGWSFQTELNGIYTDQTQIGSWGQYEPVFRGEEAQAAQFGAMGAQSVSTNSTRNQVFSFAMPSAGTVQISATDAMRLQQEGTLRFAIYKENADGGGVRIWPKDQDWMTMTSTGTEVSEDFESFKVAGKAGEKIRFVVSNGVDSFAGKKYVWTPVVTYIGSYDETLDVKSLSFVYSEAFSDVQGANWYYQYASFADDFPYQQARYVDGAWRNGAGSYYTGVIAKDHIVTGTDYDPIVSFRVPYTGVVKISTEGGIYVEDSSATPNPGDGANFGIYLRSEGDVIKNVYPGGSAKTFESIAMGGQSAFREVTLSVKKNQYIWFRFNMGNGATANNWHDVVSFSPMITYMTVEKEDAGVRDETGSAAQKHTGAGSNLDMTQFPVIGREFADSYIRISANEFHEKLMGGQLAAGCYELGADEILVFDQDDSNKTVDARGIKVRISPSEKTGVLFDNVSDLKLKNLTIEITGKPAQLLKTNSVSELNLKNWEISYSGIAKNINLLTTMGTAPSEDVVSMVIDGLRFVDESNSVREIVFSDAAAYATIKNSYIDGISGCIVTDDGTAPNGVCIENNILKGDQIAVHIAQDRSIVKYNTITGDIEAAQANFVLVAANDVDGSVNVYGGKLGSIGLNECTGSIRLSDGIGYALADNQADEIAVKASNTIVEDNSGTIAVSGNDNYGSNVFDQSVRRSVGVNQDLIPKVDNTLFRGEKRAEYINDGGTLRTLGTYISNTLLAEDVVILAPGAYSTGTISVGGIKNAQIYGYAALMEGRDYANFALTVTNADNVKIKGVSITYAEQANGQATVTEIGDDYIRVIADPGFISNITAEEGKYSVDAAFQGFRAGSDIPFGDYYFYNRSYDASTGITTLSTTTGTAKQFVKGDKLTLRGLGNKVVYCEAIGNVLFEDVTLFTGAGFGFMECNGYGNTQLNRCSITPSAPAELDADDPLFSQWQTYGLVTEKDGKYYGPAALVATCDATHSINMRVGMQITNCIFIQMTDDATNVNGCYSRVSGFDRETKTITYVAGAYNSYNAPFEAGDEVVVFTMGGELLCHARAVSATRSEGGAYAVQIDQTFDFAGSAILQNLSACGNGFLYDNCIVGKNRSRGLLIKAHNGKIINCDIIDTGMSGILVKPELPDGWSEVGYVSNLEILNNRLSNNGYVVFDGKEVLFTPINISGDGQNTTDIHFQMHSNIRIEGNVIERRATPYAINIDSARDVVVRGNQLKGRNGKADDAQTPIRISTSTGVEVSDNVYCDSLKPESRVYATDTARRVFGTDIVVKYVADYVDTTSEAIFSGGRWYVVLKIENISDAAVSVQLSDFEASGMELDTQRRVAENIAPGEIAKFYIPVTKLPQDMIPPVNSGNVSYRITLADGISGDGRISNLSFNVISRTEDGSAHEDNALTAKNDDGFSMTGSFAYDNDNLYVNITVRDLVHYQTQPDWNMWTEDCVQIALDPGRANGFASAGQCELGVGFYQDGTVKTYAWSNSISTESHELIQADVQRDEDNKLTIYKISIPWKLVGVGGMAPQPGDEIGINVVANNLDGPGEERSYLELFGGIATNKNAANFGAFLIENTDTVLYDVTVDESSADYVTVSTDKAMPGNLVYIRFDGKNAKELVKWELTPSTEVDPESAIRVALTQSNLLIRAEMRTVEQDDDRPGDESDEINPDAGGRKDTQSPTTGDSEHPELWALVALLAVGTCLILAWLKKKAVVSADK